MTLDRKTAVTAGARAMLGTLLLTMSGTGAARAEPVQRLAHRDVATVGSLARSIPSPDERDPRPANVVREHLKAQRIIDRVCTGC
ncbi:hypothetical protein [Methylobacterium sp. ID0610]|uniref:hypothetical protein n=1 Tax=Methylobacterium carpenticola TaxID=3344827 RepID=UPI0036B9588E